MKDWKKASWIDPDKPWEEPLKVPDKPERILFDFATKCNLRCPMCAVWGSDNERAQDEVKGIMNLDNARKVLDEIMESKPMIAPSLYGEPLLIPDLENVIKDLKTRNLPVVINTNGLNLSDNKAKLLCDMKVDSVMFSLDAATPETLKKVRGVDKLQKIKDNVQKLLITRGDAEYPRIGVSYTVQDDNRHEVEQFEKEWVGNVDVVRIGLVFDNATGVFPGMKTSGERKPCPALYKTLPIHNDGTATLCCLDGFRATKLENVFETSVDEVWHGEQFSKARYYHETGQFEKVPFCASCNGWAEYDYEEEVKDGLLIRRSPQYVYYNKIDRLKNWKGTLLGGHKPPPSDITES